VMASVPNGWLECAGQDVNKVTYSRLFDLIGTTYGPGSVNSFTLPNLRGVFIRGAGSNTIGGVNYTGTLGVLQGDQMQGHNHTINNDIGTEIVGSSSAAPTASLWSTSPTVKNNTASNFYKAKALVTDGSNGTPRSGGETRPANMALTYMIKT